MTNKKGINFSAYSALFNAVNKSVFMRDKISNQVIDIFSDENDLNDDINNEERLKKILFKEIMDKYNKRIETYNLNYKPLFPNDINNFKITKFSLVNDDNDGSSGYYAVYPRLFACKKCGDFRIFSDNKEWEQFNPNSCRREGCDGEYEQITILEYCETCGKITPVYQKCSNPEHGKDYLRLNTQGSRENLGSWRLECTAEGCNWTSDFVSSLCTHYDPFTGEQICFEDPSHLKPLNILHGGIFSSCVRNTIDVPKSMDSKYIDEILIGSYLNYWDEFSFLRGNKISKLNQYLNLITDNPTEEDRKKAINDSIMPEILEKNFEFADIIYTKVKEIESEFENINISELNDYLILNEIFNDAEDSSNVSIEALEDVSIDDFIEFGLANITYIPDIQLISSSYGTINGINKIHISGFIPHFEPHWERNNEMKRTFKAYSYPFETEGIMFDLDKVKLVNWIVENSNTYNEYVETDEDARMFLLYELDNDSPEYANLKTLIHTFSHVLIKRSSIYTGLNSDSCGELLFPTAGAFLIYSTSNINIGGFSYVFENSLLDWFRDVKLDINDCIFDPSCMDDQGACFSCTYLPEFVCDQFNSQLDRDVFIGKYRYDKGYWD